MIGAREREITWVGRTQHGFSLVEMMVALTISLILLLGVSNIIISSSQSYNELARSSQQLENGRYAVQVMRDDILHAGFYGEFSGLKVPATMPNSCLVSGTELLAAINAPVQGFAAAAQAPLGCLPGYAGGDVLVIRRAATSVTAIDSLSANDFYIQSRPGEVTVALGSAGNFALKKKDNVTLADVRKYVAHIYYIRNCNDCSGSGDGVPTLWRRELVSGNITSIPIAEGVENLQLRYGLDDNKDGAPDRYVALPSSTTEWSSVVSVEVNLLARAAEPTAGFTDSKRYVLGDVQVAPGGSFKRHAFSAVVRATNLSSRKEL
ncbi:PilW family protein [Pseudomonas sp. BN411]|uniref:PilW family protein n=1 Tax=Pseudomonas sp. BN411 TaxID=2567887 RepID=UPI002457C441|nr:PilW family protein [Pseudomonas sp. BN411]MDH4561491.1 prepilin-type N-terminal cleavage/methylation domain-containing protein [Pseudomonas sp. BN411]